MLKSIDRLSRNNGSIAGKAYFIGLTPEDRFVLRDAFGREVSPVLSKLALLFRWCNRNGYVQHGKNPLNRRYVRTGCRQQANLATVK